MLCGLGPTRFPLTNPAFNAPALPQLPPALPQLQAQAPCGGAQDTFQRAPAQGNNGAELEKLMQILRAVLQGGAGQGAAPGVGSALPQCRDLGALQGGLAGGNWAGGGLVQGTGMGVGAPPNAAAAQALDWSAQQMNPATANAVNPNNGQSAAMNPDAWTNYCLKFVSAAYGYQVPELNQETAFDSYKQFAGQGRLSNDRNPPAGAPVFFNQTGNTPYGHVGIATGKTDANGEPIIRTTGIGDFKGIQELPLSVVEKNSAQYLGWGKI